MSATLVTLVAYMLSKEAHEKYEQDLLDNPAQPDEALATWIKGLLHELCLSTAIDGCNAAVTKLCRSLASVGLMARRGLTGCAPSACVLTDRILPCPTDLDNGLKVVPSYT